MDAIVVPCTQQRIWDSQPTAGPVAAKDAYITPTFFDWRRHAEKSGCSWFILSTKYGLVRPDERIERYNIPVSAALANPDFLRMLEQQGRAT